MTQRNVNILKLPEPSGQGRRLLAGALWSAWAFLLLCTSWACATSPRSGRSQAVRKCRSLIVAGPGGTISLRAGDGGRNDTAIIMQRGNAQVRFGEGDSPLWLYLALERRSGAPTVMVYCNPKDRGRFLMHRDELKPFVSFEYYALLGQITASLVMYKSGDAYALVFDNDGGSISVHDRTGKLTQSLGR